MPKNTRKTKQQPPRMPTRLPDDPPEVTVLLDASEVQTAHANRWRRSANPNEKAAYTADTLGWAYAVAAAYLRCALKGEVPSCFNPQASARPQGGVE